MKHFAYDEQVASQADAVRDVLARIEVPRLDGQRPIILAGTGTSLHACRVAAYWAAELSQGRLRPAAVETHEYALRGAIHPDDQIVVVSHRGTKRFPHQLFERARQAGVETIAVSGYGAADPGGDVVLRTCPDERASTHSVSYLTALAVLGRLVARFVGPAAADFDAKLSAIPAAIQATLAKPAPVDVLARVLHRAPWFLTGFGIDELSAQEAALKIKEGTYLWAEAMSVELALHGTPAVFEPRMAAIVLVPDIDDGGRTASLRALLGTLGVEVLTAGTGDADLPFAPVDYLLRPFVSIVPLQRLVAELARRRGSNPDTTREDVEPWASAIARVRL